MKEKLKVGDIVKIIDGSWAVRVDKPGEYNSIGLCKDNFEVIACDEGVVRELAVAAPLVHDIFVKNKVDQKVYLHSACCVRKVKDEKKEILKQTLKKTILQWELMLETGKSKEDCYTFLGGQNFNFFCFLCDEYRIGNDYNFSCIDCLNWKSNKKSTQCLDRFSPYREYENTRNEKSIQSVLDYLKSQYNLLTKND